jgi:hypothetical protein
MSQTEHNDARRGRHRAGPRAPRRGPRPPIRDAAKPFESWLQAREPQELVFKDAYADAMRIPRDDDTNGTGAAKAQKSKLFVGSTRGKIRSARAKIKDSLFGAGRMPFDTSPTNEQLKGYSDTMEAILEFQLKDMNFRGMMGGAVNALCTYGTGVVFGPFERTKEHVTVGLVPDAESGVPVLGENRFEYRAPYFEHGPTMDVYPDPEAADTQSGLGVFWSSWKQPHEIKSWRGLDGYNDEAHRLRPHPRNPLEQRAGLGRHQGFARQRLPIQRGRPHPGAALLRARGRRGPGRLDRRAAAGGPPRGRHRGGRRHHGRRRRGQGRPNPPTSAATARPCAPSTRRRNTSFGAWASRRTTTRTSAW